MIAAALPRLLQGENARLQTLCDGLDPFLDFSGRWDEWLWLSRQAEEKAVAANDRYKAGWRACFAGWAYHLREQVAERLACAARAVAHWQEANAGVLEQAIAIRLLGVGHELEKDYPAAIAAYQRALALSRTLAPESEGAAIALNALAGAERHSGDYAAAERDFCEALRVAKKINHREGVAIYTGNLAAAQSTLQECEQGG